MATNQQTDKPVQPDGTAAHVESEPTEGTNSNARNTDEPYNGRNFLADCLASQSFGNYLGDTDTDTENASLPPHRRWVWYCKHRACPKYYSAWASKTNWLLHLYETPEHREDSTTTTREGRLELAKAWREETAFDLSEPKKLPPDSTIERARQTTATFSMREMSELF
ncbi:hypothetical protein F4803DRAFT_533180 [Xylaria telfairii]|nr:hypothetical protein F4803DRAFT_533180 [Xylaria telfairii]